MAITSKLAIDIRFFGGAEGGEIPSDFSIAAWSVCACMHACSNSSDTLNANNFHVLYLYWTSAKIIIFLVSVDY